MTSNDVNISDVLEALNDKMDRDLNNRSINSGLRKLKASYYNDGNWYKIFEEIQSDGSIKEWCEQGGYELNHESDYLQTITLLKPFSNTKYLVFLTGTDNNHADDNGSWNCTSKLTTTFTIFNSSDHINNIYWYACGYIN